MDEQGGKGRLVMRSSSGKLFIESNGKLKTVEWLIISVRANSNPKES